MLGIRFIFGIVVGGLLLVGTAVQAESIDLTTYGHDTEQARVARYTVNMGMAYADTVANGNAYLGAYDYMSYRSGDGGVGLNNGGDWHASTLGCHTWGAPVGDDFFGYRFKRPATIAEINFANRVFDNGGVFDGQPRVEVLTGGPAELGGTWTAVAATCTPTYDTTYSPNPYPTWSWRDYTFTPDAPTGEVWGVRLIGPGHGTNGHVGCGELQVLGESSISDTIDLSINLALGQTPLWTHGGANTEYGRPEILTDGDLWHANWDTTYHETLTASEDLVGVMFDTEKSNVGAVGITMVLLDASWRTGGWITSSNLRVEYTTDSGASWTPVSNLDLGRLPNMESELDALTWNYWHSELLTFDTIPVAIDGIRMIGPAVAGAGDADGYIGTLEFEVFAVPEPSILMFLSSLLGGLLVWRTNR